MSAQVTEDVFKPVNTLAQNAPHLLAVLIVCAGFLWFLDRRDARIESSMKQRDTRQEQALASLADAIRLQAESYQALGMTVSETKNSVDALRVQLGKQP